MYSFLHFRYFIRNISKKHQTISELQIFNATRGDTGKYTCVAVSDIGTDEGIIQFVVQGKHSLVKVFLLKLLCIY